LTLLGVVSVADWAAVASAVVAAVGVIVAVSSFRASLASGPRLIVGLGDYVHVHFTEGRKQLIVTIELIVINKGAQAGALTEVTGMLQGAGRHIDASPVEAIRGHRIA
jgi:hypothetical protein